MDLCARLAETVELWTSLQKVKAPVIRYVPPEGIQRVDEGGKEPGNI